MLTANVDNLTEMQISWNYIRTFLNLKNTNIINKAEIIILHDVKQIKKHAKEFCLVKSSSPQFIPET